MNLSDYLIQCGRSQKELAACAGIHPVLIHQWASGKRRVPAEHCPAIERATHGAVRCEDLRPDVDWAYLRGTQPNPTNGLSPEVAETTKEAA